MAIFNKVAMFLLLSSRCAVKIPRKSLIPANISNALDEMCPCATSLRNHWCDLRECAEGVVSLHPTFDSNTKTQRAGSMRSCKQMKESDLAGWICAAKLLQVPFSMDCIMVSSCSTVQEN